MGAPIWNLVLEIARFLISAAILYAMDIARLLVVAQANVFVRSDVVIRWVPTCHGGRLPRV